MRHVDIHREMQHAGRVQLMAGFAAQRHTHTRGEMQQQGRQAGGREGKGHARGRSGHGRDMQGRDMRDAADRRRGATLDPNPKTLSPNPKPQP